MNETWVTVVGNVASTVTGSRVGAEGQLRVGFRVASNERRWDKASDTWGDGDRFSAWVTCWRGLAEHVLGSLVKGDPVVVRGRLSVREYEVNGERRYSTEVAASAVGPDLTRCTAQLTRPRASSEDDAANPSGETADATTATAGNIGTPASPEGDPLVAAHRTHHEDATTDPSAEPRTEQGADEPTELPAAA